MNKNKKLIARGSRKRLIVLLICFIAFSVLTPTDTRSYLPQKRYPKS
jgi:hypothetical protein